MNKTPGNSTEARTRFQQECIEHVLATVPRSWQDGDGSPLSASLKRGGDGTGDADDGSAGGDGGGCGGGGGAVPSQPAQSFAHLGSSAPHERFFASGGVTPTPPTEVMHHEVLWTKHARDWLRHCKETRWRDMVAARAGRVARG